MVSDNTDIFSYVELTFKMVFKADKPPSNTDLKRLIGVGLSAETEVVCCVDVRPVPGSVGADEEVSLYF